MFLSFLTRLLTISMGGICPTLEGESTAPPGLDRLPRDEQNDT